MSFLEFVHYAPFIEYYHTFVCALYIWQFIISSGILFKYMYKCNYITLVMSQTLDKFKKNNNNKVEKKNIYSFKHVVDEKWKNNLIF